MAVTMVGMLLPSTTLTYFATRSGAPQSRAARRARVQAGYRPRSSWACCIATGWVLVRGGVETTFNARIVAVALVSMRDRAGGRACTCCGCWVRSAVGVAGRRAGFWR